MTKYRTIVADPPWRYTKVPTPRTGAGASAEHVYRTMSSDDIAALPIAQLADDNAHLYLWVTNPMLLNLRPGIRGIKSPLDIVEAWGFEPKTMLTWVKSTKEGSVGRGGLGWYFRGATEHVIFAVRGVAGIESHVRAENVFNGMRRGHSTKPDRFYELVERVSRGPYLELFARRRRYGWDVWGNEAPTDQASQAVLGLEGVA